MKSKVTYAHKWTEDGTVVEDIIITRLYADSKWGTMYRVKGPRHFFDFRMTPTGLLRQGPIRKHGAEEGVIDGG